MANPVLSNISQQTPPDPYIGYGQFPVTRPEARLATLGGIAGKLGMLLAVTAVIAGIAVRLMPELGRTEMYIALGGSGIIAIICSVMLVKKPHLGAILGLILAVAEGVLAGAITAVAVQVTGNYSMVWSALLATAGTFLAMYVLFATGLIKATARFRAVVSAAVLGVGIFYGIAFVLSFFNIEAPLIFSTSGWGIGFTIAVIILAAMTLIIDFDDARALIGRGPANREWGIASGLLVSLVWLYIEFLRLFLKLASSD